MIDFHKLINIKRFFIYLVLLILILTIVVSSEAAYKIGRPVQLNDEPINQSYLYGEISGNLPVHKGLDWGPGVVFGDSVYAVAGGTVRQVVSNRPNGCSPDNPELQCPAWGNFVLIRHSRQHYDTTEGTMAYVYSLYLHLRQDHVFVNLNDEVTEGDLIAQVDDTGASTGNHLHLQIIINPCSNCTIEPYTLESEQRSRNPENWLNPLQGTVRVMGKITDAAGNPSGGLLIYGLEKNPTWGYGSSQTYDDPDINSDDLLMENWATTDVNPGWFQLTTSEGSNLGVRQMIAGRTNYVGLFPVFAPVSNSSTADYGWDSTIYLRNNSSTYTEQIPATLLSISGYVNQQQTYMLNPRGMSSYNRSGSYTLSGMASGSADTSAVVVTRKKIPIQAHAYTAIPATDSADPSKHFQFSATHYLPVLYSKSLWEYYSAITIQNPEPAAVDVTINYYDQNGNPYGSSPYTYPIDPYGSKRITLYNAYGWTDFFGTAIISSENQQGIDAPVAVVVESWNNGKSMAMDYNAIPEGSIYVELAYLMKNYGGWYSCSVVQNTTSYQAEVQPYYYTSSGTIEGEVFYLAGYAAKTVCQKDVAGLGTTSSAEVIADQPVAVVVNQDNNWSGTANQVMSYSGLASTAGSLEVVLPYLVSNHNDNGNWNSGIWVSNLVFASNTVTITYYDANGVVVKSKPYVLGSRKSIGIYLPNEGLGDTYIGSARVSSQNNPILVLASASCSSCSKYQDSSLTYNGINR